MQRTLLKSLLLYGLLAAHLAGPAAQAAGRLLEVSVRDRETGAEIPATWARGEWWIVGRPGARYGISVRNRLAERVLAVTAVDGVNVVTGQTAAWDQSGYVLDAQQGYEITGWRKSDAEVAAFEFTVPPDAYATRTGRPANLGVIGVAVFRERIAYVPAVTNTPPEESYDVRAQASAPAQAPSANAANAADATLAPRETRAATAASGGLAARELPALGTGHGARESSWIAHTDFERRSARPDEVIRIRYDSREHLIAMGILPRPPRHLLTNPNPFPGSPDGPYVPDPPAG